MDKSVAPLKDDVRRHTKEAPMESTGGISTDQPINKVASAKACVHSRLIDDVLTRCGQRTGKVRCLECSAVIEDPHHSQR